MTNFGNRFRRLINEQDLDRAAMEASLDKDTDPEEFDVDVEPSGEGDDMADIHAQAQQAINSRQAAMVAKINDWVSHLDEFVHKLNGQENDSIQTTLAKAEADTILDKMRQAEQRKIARVATEIAALAESFRGYLAQSNSSSLKNV